MPCIPRPPISTNRMASRRMGSAIFQRKPRSAKRRSMKKTPVLVAATCYVGKHSQFLERSTQEPSRTRSATTGLHHKAHKGSVCARNKPPALLLLSIREDHYR